MSYHYYVSGWIGRTGNHLLQLSHAIYLAEKYGGICEFRENDFFRNKIFDFSNGIPIENYFNESFWELNPKYTLSTENYSEDLHQERPRILRDYILPIFNPYKKIDSNFDLVINIRGGDILTGKGSPPQYVQAPLSYFLYILEKENPKKVLLVCEDRKNPVINQLEKTNYNIEVHADNDPFTDANEVLNSKKLVIGGVSTFTLLLAQMSFNVDTVYYPKFEDGWNLSEDELWKRDHWYNFENFLGIMKSNIVPVTINNYIKIGRWGDYSLEEKIEHMLNHSTEDLFIK